MKIKQKLLTIFLTLLATYVMATYLEYLHGTHELFNITIFSACFSVGVIAILIMLYIESKKFGYVIVILFTFGILAPVFAMEVLNFDENSARNKEWFAQRYSPWEFKIESIIFYPLILLFYMLFFSFRGENSVKMIKKNFTNIQKVIA